MLTAERLREVLNYDPETGVFTWKASKGSKAQAGDEAGYVHKTLGYRYIQLDGKMYLAHRLAHLYMTGEFPIKVIDHKNKTSFDNTWLNLRDVTYAVNSQNHKVSKANASGATGVSWDPKRNKWRARIVLNRKDIHLGRFDSFEEALEARKQAEQELFTLPGKDYVSDSA